MRKAKRAAYNYLPYTIIVVFILFAAAAFFAYDSLYLREQKKIIIEAQDTYNRNGVPIPQGLIFYRNGFVSKDVKVPESWVGKNMKISIIAKADEYLLEPPSTLDWSYNVTATLLDDIIIKDVLESPESKGGELLNVKMELNQKNGLTYSYLYSPRPNYSEVKDYTNEKKALARKLRSQNISNAKKTEVTENATLTGVKFTENSIISLYRWNRLYYPKYAVVSVVINDTVRDRIGIDSSEWKEYKTKYPILVAGNHFTVEVAYIDDIYVDIQQKDGEVKTEKRFDRNFYIDKILLEVE